MPIPLEPLMLNQTRTRQSNAPVPKSHIPCACRLKRSIRSSLSIVFRDIFVFNVLHCTSYCWSVSLDKLIFLNRVICVHHIWRNNSFQIIVTSVPCTGNCEVLGHMSPSDYIQWNQILHINVSKYLTTSFIIKCETVSNGNTVARGKDTLTGIQC